jgi:PAS domain S-box-containing protein
MKAAMIYSDTSGPENMNTEEIICRELLESTQELIWRCDVQGHFTWLNPAWQPVFDSTIKEMTGKKITALLSPEKAEETEPSFRQLLVHGSPIKNLDTLFLGKRGREIHLLINAVPVRDKKAFSAVPLERPTTSPPSNRPRRS